LKITLAYRIVEALKVRSQIHALCSNMKALTCKILKRACLEIDLASLERILNQILPIQIG